MSITQKGTLPEQADHLGKIPFQNKVHYTTQLTPRHQRVYAALVANPEGLLSFDLRHRCGCMNIADEVMAMRRQGFNITCTLEPFITVDGANSKIGHYRLVQNEEVKPHD